MIKLNYTDFKSIVAGKNLQAQYVIVGGGTMYAIRALDATLEYYTAIAITEPANDEQLDFEGGLKLKCNRAIRETMTSINAPFVSLIKPDIPSATLVSHDWCDKTTWYTSSVRVTDETLATSDNLTFNSANAYWIDLTHGKVYGEHLITGKNPIVRIDGTPVTTGFTINYATGQVVFGEAVQGTVTVDYSYATNSLFVLAPLPGKSLIIEHSEVQFCKNVTVTSPITFEAWAWHPDQVNNPGVKIMVDKLVYNNEKDIINSCNLGQGWIPRFGNLADDVLVFPFNYVTTKPLPYSKGAEIRIRITGDQPFPGSFTTVTFYILSRNEP